MATKLLGYITLTDKKGGNARIESGYQQARLHTLLTAGCTSQVFSMANPAVFGQELKGLIDNSALATVTSFNPVTLKNDKGEETDSYYEVYQVDAGELLRKINYHVEQYPNVKTLDDLTKLIKTVDSQGKDFTPPTAESKQGRKAVKVNLSGIAFK